MHHLAGRLNEHGIDLREVRVVPDDTDAIVQAVLALRDTWGTVFTSGGIGPTHDDITADAIASAFGVHIDVRDDARAILAERYAARGVELTEARLRMARIPDGATLIENPVSGAPGFSIGGVHVMAGVPSVFEAMLASVLPTLSGGTPLQSRTVQNPPRRRRHRRPAAPAGGRASRALDRLVPRQHAHGLRRQRGVPRYRSGGARTRRPRRWRRSFPTR